MWACVEVWMGMCGGMDAGRDGKGWDGQKGTSLFNRLNNSPLCLLYLTSERTIGMGTLKEQIRESYFNPVLQMLPALTFIVAHYVWGLEAGWWCSVGITLALTLYVHKVYRGLFGWFMLHMLLLLVIVSLMCVTAYVLRGTAVARLADKVVFLLSLIVLSLCQKPLVRVADRLVSPLIPMSNNILEFYNIVHIFIVLASLYVAAYLLFLWAGRGRVSADFEVVNIASVGFILLLIAFYVVKITFVRRQLATERWLPILNRNGKIIGAIQRISSLTDRRRFTHPVVRGFLVKDGRLLLQKPVDNPDLFYAPCWDCLVDSHVCINEKPDDCLKKALAERFAIEPAKSLYLTKYIEDTPYEHQYVLVYVISHYSGDLTPNPRLVEQMKWWTQPQIEANLNSGIFNSKFIKEYSLLKRSGLLDAEETHG